VDGEKRVAVVVLVEEQGLKLGFLEALRQGGKGLFQFFSDVFSLVREVGQDLDLFLFLFQPGKGFDLVLELFPLLLKRLRLLLILPDGRG